MYGAGAGLLTGLESSAVDCFYVCVGAFGLTVISDFLLHYPRMIHGGRCFHRNISLVGNIDRTNFLDI